MSDAATAAAAATAVGAETRVDDLSAAFATMLKSFKQTHGQGCDDATLGAAIAQALKPMELPASPSADAIAGALTAKSTETAAASPNGPSSSAGSSSAMTVAGGDGDKPIRVYIDGCFDIMHSGHYNAIRQAKMIIPNCFLVVGVHSSAEILRHKGPPVMSDDERLATVRACKWVDEIQFDTPYDPSVAMLDKFSCTFCVHGDDTSTAADGTDAYADVRSAGRLKIVKRTEGISTTDLVGRLLLMTKNHHLQTPSLTPARSPMDDKGSSADSSAHDGSDSVDALLARGSLSSSLTKDDAFLLGPAASMDVAVGGDDSVHSVAADDTKNATPAKDGANKKHYARAISSFLPTTWRITQFSNNRKPSPSDTVVYIDGSFDLFHIGHIRTLEKAKELGTFLYVGIHDDATVNTHKGDNFPIMNLHERVLNVLSCKYVDEVVIGAPWTVTQDLIKVLHVDIVASGSNTKLADDADVNSEADPHQAAKDSGIFREIQTSHLLSTDDVVQRIVENRLKYSNRNRGRAKKEVAYYENKAKSNVRVEEH